MIDNEPTSIHFDEGPGSVELVESWGSDERIIEAARMSTGKGFLGWEDEVDGEGKVVRKGDARLLSYLYTHNHLTPFEMAGAVLEVTCPIFTAREWMRHRSASYNEMSARYTELPAHFYLPSLDRLGASGQSLTNRQGSGVGLGEKASPEGLQEDLELSYTHSWMAYQSLLSSGVAREVARMVLPVGIMTRFRTSANLRNWLHFLTLRTDEAAQWEIRALAEEVHSLLEGIFPRTLALWKDGLS